MKLIIASNNAHKIAEIKAILKGHFDEIVSQGEAGVDIEVVENGVTFEQNAVKKAVEIQNYFPDCAVIADDSGLCVDALDGAPGVYSARFAKDVSSHGEKDIDEQNNLKLLYLMEEVPDGERSCRFVSSVALAKEGGGVITAEGVCEGFVTRAPQGAGGFGYDPLFYVSELEKTYAELTAEEKNAISHRAKALYALRKLL